MDKIKDIIPQVISQISVAKPEIQDKIQQIWRSTFNEKTARHTTVVSLHKGQLRVHVDSPAWLFQMSRQKRNIRRYSR